jgi:hypothetical protein
MEEPPHAEVGRHRRPLTQDSALERDTSGTNRKQRHCGNNCPQVNPLQKWAHADATQCTFREPRANQKQIHGEPYAAQSAQQRIHFLPRQETCLGYGSQTEPGARRKCRSVSTLHSAPFCRTRPARGRKASEQGWTQVKGPRVFQ